jgi:hypothetical protein
MPKLSPEEYEKRYGPLGTFIIVGRPLSAIDEDLMVPYRTPEERKKVDEAYARLLKGRTLDQYVWDIFDEVIKEAEAKEKKP